MSPIFITGIGTEVGKTLVAAIVTEALQADYWKPVQAGYADGTDSEWVRERLSNPVSRIHPETYKLALPASPHIAAREEGQTISLSQIREQAAQIARRPLVIEGAGGLLVPLNDREFILDLVKELDARVLLVSRNYLGSINHSLLTAGICRAHDIKVAGWVFNDQYGHYETEICDWSGFPSIGSIPRAERTDRRFVSEQAGKIRTALQKALLPDSGSQR